MAVSSVILVSFTLPLVGLLAYNVSSLSDWYTQEVNESGDKPFNVICIDSEDRVHIADILEQGYSLNLAHLLRDGSGWDPTLLAPIWPGSVSMALDSRGSVHVLSSTPQDYDYNRSLVYATNKTGSWTVETLEVDAANRGDFDSSALAVDSNGMAHIIYNLGDDYVWSLWYAANSNGSWVHRELIAPEEDAYETYASVHSVTWSSDGLHLVYYLSSKTHNDTTGVYTSYSSSRYAIVSGEVMNSVDFPSEYSGATSISMAVGADRVSHFAFYNPDPDENYTIVHAEYDGTHWSGESIADAGCCFWWPDRTAIALDHRGKVHITYYTGDWTWVNNVRVHTGNRSICYISDANGPWEGIVIERVGGWELGDDTSIAIDSADRVHISYLKRYTSHNLYHEPVMYATNSRGAEMTSAALAGAFLASGIVALVTTSVYLSYRHIRLRRPR